MPVLDISRYEAHGIIGIYAILSVYDFQNETATILILGARSFELYIYLYTVTFDRILNSGLYFYYSIVTRQFDTFSPSKIMSVYYSASHLIITVD